MGEGGGLEVRELEKRRITIHFAHPSAHSTPLRAGSASFDKLRTGRASFAKV